MINYASVADACGIFAGATVFDGFNEDFDRILARAEVDDFERLFNDVGGFCFFAAVLAGSHEVVYEAFNYVDVCFTETLMLMPSHAMGCGHGCEVQVSLQAYIFDFGVFEAPLLEKFNLVLRYAHVNHLAGFCFRP